MNAQEKVFSRTEQASDIPINIKGRQTIIDIPYEAVQGKANIPPVNQRIKLLMRSFCRTMTLRNNGRV